MTHTLEVHARRWFQRSAGNTYHSVRVVIDGQTVGVRSDVYGYGRHYLHTAGAILIDAGMFDHDDGPAQTPYDAVQDWVDAHKAELVETVEDVARKRDLLPAWWAEGMRRAEA